MKTLNAKQLKMMHDGPAEITLLDVLPEDSFNEQHIPGAVNIPVGGDDFVDRVEDLVRDKAHPIVVYCANEDCDASPTAATKLEEAGYANVYDFPAGIKGWTDAGYDIAHPSTAG